MKGGGGGGHGKAPGDLLKEEDKGDGQFAIVFAAMGVNMETAHFFKQVRPTSTSGSLHAGELEISRSSIA